jgi:hypothetical protein
MRIPTKFVRIFFICVHSPWLLILFGKQINCWFAGDRFRVTSCGNGRLASPNQINRAAAACPTESIVHSVVPKLPRNDIVCSKVGQFSNAGSKLQCPASSKQFADPMGVNARRRGLHHITIISFGKIGPYCFIFSVLSIFFLDCQISRNEAVVGK